MLLTEKVTVKISASNYKYYKIIFPDIKMFSNIDIDVNLLPKNSIYKVKCVCDVCGKEKNITYRSYIKNLNRYNYYSCKKCKNIKTYKTKKLLYNNGNYNNSDKMKETKQEIGVYLKNNELKPIIKYRHQVNNITLKNKKILFKNWNGYDYYDGEYIKPYLKLKSNDENYPTIDHKITIFYGYINDIKPEIIGNINNLCITKRYLNSKKGKNNEYFN